jgi:hypothetical protein
MRISLLLINDSRKTKRAALLHPGIITYLIQAFLHNYLPQGFGQFVGSRKPEIRQGKGNRTPSDPCCSPTT